MPVREAAAFQRIKPVGEGCHPQSSLNVGMPCCVRATERQWGFPEIIALENFPSLHGYLAGIAHSGDTGSLNWK